MTCIYERCASERSNMQSTDCFVRSRAHKLETVKCCKVALSPYDDKRYVLDDGMATLAYGHVRIGQ